MPSQLMRVSFPLCLHDGTSHDVEGEMIVVWRECHGPDETLAALEQAVLVSAAVDDMPLTEAQFTAFQTSYQHLYEEALEWIALSTIEARVSGLN